MFITGKTLVVTTEELANLVGEAKKMPDGTVGLTREQFEMFTDITMLYIVKHCDKQVSTVIVSIHASIMLMTFILLLTGMPTPWPWPLMAIPGTLVVASFVFLLFRARVIFWMAQRHELMLVHVHKTEDEVQLCRDIKRRLEDGPPES